DDSCLVERDLANFVMGEVRFFSSINNLRVLLHNEGFTDIEMVYLGGLWVLIKLGFAKAKLNFMKHTGVASWFVRICNAQNDFVANDRIVWVDIEGVPLHAWSNATFHKIGKVFPIRAKELFVWSPSFKEVPEVVHFSDDESVKKDVVINEVDNSVSTKGEESESEAVSDTVFGDNGDTLDHDNEVDQSINDKEVSNDPFKIYELLNKNKNGVDNSGKEYSIPYSPGFTPDQANVTFVQEAQEIHGEDSIHSHHSADHCSSRIFVAVEKPYINFQPDGRVIKDARKEGGSILDILDEIIKVGQTMGFTMDGCTKDMEKIIGSNGVRWAIEGDENSKFFHGIINRKRANLSIKGIMIDEEWVEDPIRVKEEFCNHFADRFNDSGLRHGRINFDFPNRLKPEQVDFAKAYDSIRWDYLDDVLSAFGFGSRWRSWIRGCRRGYFLRMSINLKKSHILGLGIRESLVSDAAASLGCSVMKMPFNYLGIMVPKSVLNKMESLQRDFFNGIQEGVQKVSWVKWQTVLA
nr:hypothetical protein [Tanacetum cinerariifolium]